MNRYYVYEYLRKHNGATDYQLVSNFEGMTSEEIFEGKCLYEDYRKKAQPVGRQNVRCRALKSV